MQISEQVAGEALQILASKIAHSNAWAKAGGFTHATVLLTDADATLIIEALAAALRAQPERGAEEIRDQIAGIIKYRGDRARLAMQGSMDGYTRNEAVSDLCRALEFEIRALPLHPVKDEGGGR